MLAYETVFSGIFKVFLVLHVFTAIVGLGGVMLNGLYAAQAQKRPGPTGRAVSEANFAVSMVAEKFIYVIPVFGILLVLTSDGLLQVQQHVRVAVVAAVHRGDRHLAQHPDPGPQEDQHAAPRDGARSAARRWSAAAGRADSGAREEASRRRR